MDDRQDRYGLSQQIPLPAKHVRTYSENMVSRVWIGAATVAAILFSACNEPVGSGSKSSAPKLTAAELIALIPDDLRVPPRPEASSADDAWPMLAKAMRSYEGVKTPDLLKRAAAQIPPILEVGLPDVEQAQTILSALSIREQAFGDARLAAEKQVLWIQVNSDGSNAALGDDSHDDESASPERFKDAAEFKQLIKDLSWRVLCLGRIGHHAEAVKDFAAMRRLIRLWFSGHGDAIQFLVGDAALSIADKAIRTYAAVYHPPAEFYSAVISVFERNPIDLFAALNNASRKELEQDASEFASRTGADHEGNLAALYASHPDPFDAAKTIKLECNNLQQSISMQHEPWVKQRSALTALYQQETHEIPKELLATDAVEHPEPTPTRLAELAKELKRLDNPEGRVTATMNLQSLMVAGEGAASRQAEDAMTLAILAIQCYLSQRGAMPDSLEALVAAHLLRSVPTDPVSGAPVRYSPVKGIVWCVGVDGIDQGGATTAGAAWQKGQDWVFEVRAAGK